MPSVYSRNQRRTLDTFKNLGPGWLNELGSWITCVLTPLSAIFQLYHGDQLLVVEEAGVPGENHRRWASNW
jgi:hypothetical protein